MKMMFSVLTVLTMMFAVVSAYAEPCTNGERRCSRDTGMGAPQTCVNGEWQCDVPECPTCYSQGMLCIEEDGQAGCWCSTAPQEPITNNYYLDSEYDLNMFRNSLVQNVQGTIEVTQEEIVDVTMHNLDELSCLQHVDTLWIHDTVTIKRGSATLFPQLTSVGTLIVEHNTQLETLSMISLVEAADSVIFYDNDMLEKVSLWNLSKVGGDLEFDTLDSFWQVILDDLQKVDGDFVINDTWLTEYSIDLYELDKIGGVWYVHFNDLLPYATLCGILDQMSVMPTTNFDDNLPDACWDETGTFACEC